MGKNAQKKNQADGKFSVVDGDNGETIEKDIPTEEEAKTIVEEFDEGEDIADIEAADLKSQSEVAGTAVASTAGPQASVTGSVTGGGLHAEVAWLHQRIDNLTKTLAKHGFYHRDDTRPAQNPQASPQNLARNANPNAVAVPADDGTVSLHSPQPIQHPQTADDQFAKPQHS